jgi:multidrug resistance efflux pump
MRKSPPQAELLRIVVLGAVIGCAACGECSAESRTSSIIVTAPGRIESATNIMLLGTAATGTIAELLVNESARVEAGQLLVRIDCASIQNELDARSFQLAAAEAVLERLVKGPRPEEIAMAIANVTSAEAREEETRLSLRRISPSEGATTTESQLDQLKRDARVAAAQLVEARARLALLQSGSRQEEIVEARSLRDAAKAFVEEAAARLSHCFVRAPAAGVILSIHVTPGQFVSAAVPVTLLKLADDRGRRIRAEVDELDLNKICVRQNAVVTAESFPDVQIDAVTEWMSESMTRPTLPNGRAGKGDRDVREVTLSLSERGLNWPLGLQASVKFAACPTDRGGPTR